jgi:hypothetical protein
MPKHFVGQVVEPAAVVGQPILAAAGFQPALFARVNTRVRGVRHKRRGPSYILGGGIAARLKSRTPNPVVKIK